MDRPRVSLHSQPASGEDSPKPLTDETGVGAPRPDALPPGSRLDEYRIERVIGASGFGIVYLAQDTALDRPVAIKEYLPDTLAMRGEDGLQVMLRAPSHAESFERGRRAFIEEAQLLAQCDHPSLLRVLRKWEGNGTVYRAMPCYRGQTLLSLRQSMQGPPDEASLRGLLDGLMEALETLHAVGGVHREVSPANILLLPDDRPVLMDWSAARRAIVGNQARALMTLLAPSFAPIEQVMPAPERPVGPWTDVYALGMVVKYCLSGELPPPASLMSAPTHAPMAMLVRQLREKHPSLHYSPSFLAAIDGALIHLPEDRLRSIEELRQRLDDHPSARGDFLDLDLDAASAQAANDTGSMPLGEPQQPGFARPAEAGAGADRLADVPPRAAASASVPADGVPAAEHKPATGADKKPSSGFSNTPRTAPGTDQLWHGLFGARAAQAEADRFDDDSRFLAPELASEPPDIDLSQPGELPPLPAFDARTEPDISLDDRPMALAGFGERSRRARRRATWFAALLLLGSAGAAAWWMNQEREAAQAQSAFATAATRDGLTAQLPALPGPTATDGTSPPAPPVNAAQGTSGSEVDIVPAQAPRPGVAAMTPPATQDAPTQLATAVPPPAATVDAPRAAGPDVPAAAMPPAPEPAAIAPATPLTSTSGTGTAAEPARPQRPAATTARNERAARTPPKSVPARPAEPARITNPREACGNRTEFSLYRCMQAQCVKAQWKQHPSCKRLRARDEVD